VVTTDSFLNNADPFDKIGTLEALPA